MLSGPSAGEGPALATPRDIVYDVTRGRAIVADDGLGDLVAVDPESGDRTLLEEPGYSPRHATTIAYDRASDRVHVGEPGGWLVSLSLNGEAAVHRVLKHEGPSALVFDEATRRIYFTRD